MPISTATAAAAPSYGARSVRKAFCASSWVDPHRVPGVTGPGCTLRTDGARFQRSQEEGTRVPGADQTGARGGARGAPRASPSASTHADNFPYEEDRSPSKNGAGADRGLLGT